MSYEEGEHDIVSKGMYSLEEYKITYEKLGGHIRSYQELWLENKMTNDTITQGKLVCQNCTFMCVRWTINVLYLYLHTHMCRLVCCNSTYVCINT